MRVTCPSIMSSHMKGDSGCLDDRISVHSSSIISVSSFMVFSNVVLFPVLSVLCPCWWSWSAYRVSKKSRVKRNLCMLPSIQRFPFTVVVVVEQATAPTV